MPMPVPMPMPMPMPNLDRWRSSPSGEDSAQLAADPRRGVGAWGVPRGGRNFFRRGEDKPPAAATCDAVSPSYLLCPRRAAPAGVRLGLVLGLGGLSAACYSGLSGGPQQGAGTGSDDTGAGADDAAEAGTTGGQDLDPMMFDRVSTSGLRRLTVREYGDTLRDLLLDGSVAGDQQLPVDPLVPFDNDYRTQQESQGLIDATDFLAARAADALAADPERRALLVSCLPAGPTDEACMADFVRSFGRRALRRPLGDEEVDGYLHGEQGSGGALEHASAAGDFYVGIDTIIRVMLQEPEFLYRVELGTPVAGQPGVFELTQFELAARMSYFLWGTTPDDALLDLAAAGALSDAEQVADVAADMLDDPRAVDRVTRFHALWIGYSILPHGAEVSAAMQTETHALIERVLFDERQPWSELFRFSETYVSDLLAEQYGLPLPGSTTPVWVDYGDGGRRGLLSHGSFLSIGSKLNDTSPVLRGKRISERLLCRPIAPPPPGVDVDAPVQPEGAICKPERFAVHNEGNCDNCHQLMDPIGFGLENYDALGRYREMESDNPETEQDESQCVIEGAGEIIGVGTFHGPAELAELLLQDDALQTCMVDQLYRFVSGHSDLDDVDRRFVDGVTESLDRGELRFDALMLDIVADEAFRFRREEEV
jgi:Protein of unknown function (DUF1588)/Protein of unknown function (DUF1592)/Protein of unknown function (DUF1595)/Protein of unknown function (DUF1585)/Protein of unknown function (DUF1587)